MRNTPCILCMAALVTILLSVPAALGQCPGPCEGDLDGDGCVDLSDLAALLARYGICCDQAWVADEHTVALWYLNGNGLDSSGNGNDLTVMEDQVGWVNDAPHCRGVLMGEDGYPDDCFLADGGALTAPGAGCTYPGSGDWTVEAWVYFPSDSESYAIVYHYSEHIAVHEPYYLGIRSGVAYFQINNVDVVSADVSVYKKQWFHLAAVYCYQQDAALWVNGERLAVETTTDVPETLPNYDVFLGGCYCGTSLGLKIDEVRISNIARYPECVSEWVLDGTLPEPIYSQGVGLVNNAILVFGGRNASVQVSRAYLYFPGGGWDDYNIADMPQARDNMGFAPHQGRVYSIAGYLEGYGDWGRTIEVWSYDPGANVWDEETFLTYHRTDNSAASLGDYIYTIGGQHEDTGHGFSLSRVERYDGANDPWESVAPLKWDDREHTETGEALGRGALGTAVVDGRIYAIGGYSYEHPYQSFAVGRWVERYDPDTNTWDDSLPLMPTPRCFFATTLVGDRIYTIGGVTEAEVITNVVEYYDVSEGQWQADTAFPFPTYAARAVTLDATIYVIGGRTASGLLDTVYVLDVGP